MIHKTEARFQAIEKTQESRKHEIGAVKNWLGKVEEEIDEKQKSVEVKLDQVLNGFVAPSYILPHTYSLEHAQKAMVLI